MAPRLSLKSHAQLLALPLSQQRPPRRFVILDVPSARLAIYPPRSPDHVKLHTATTFAIKVRANLLRSQIDQVLRDVLLQLGTGRLIQRLNQGPIYFLIGSQVPRPGFLPRNQLIDVPGGVLESPTPPFQRKI